MQQTILIIGGTGIIGKPTALSALESGYTVVTISIEKDPTFPQEITQVVVDRSDERRYRQTIQELNRQYKHWDVVFEVYNLGLGDAQDIYELFGKCAGHIFIISTTLVYDRSIAQYAPIRSDHPLASPGSMGGYADHKRELEMFWQEHRDVNWTILRPYHVLGAGSLLGCVPLHNRDPRLLERIKNGEPLVLCNEGEVEFNAVHPRDIGRIVLTAAGNQETFRKAYNAVNPERVLAREYFETIGRLLGRPVVIENKPLKSLWEEKHGWVLTTLPHLYDVEDLRTDTGFIPSIPVERGIMEAVLGHPTPVPDRVLSEIPVHRRMTLLPRPQPIDWLIDSSIPPLAAESMERPSL